MEGSRTLFLALVVLAATIAVIANGDNGLCGVSLDELKECKPAVATGPAVPPTPTPACCAALTHANLTCFCTFKNNKSLPLFGINGTRAMQLPSKCDPTQSAHC